MTTPIMPELVKELRTIADGYAEAAKAEADIEGEGTEDQADMEYMSGLLFAAADAIERFREASATKDALAEAEAG